MAHTQRLNLMNPFKCYTQTGLKSQTASKKYPPGEFLKTAAMWGGGAFSADPPIPL